MPLAGTIGLLALVQTTRLTGGCDLYCFFGSPDFSLDPFHKIKVKHKTAEAIFSVCLKLLEDQLGDKIRGNAAKRACHKPCQHVRGVVYHEIDARCTHQKGEKQHGKEVLLFLACKKKP